MNKGIILAAVIFSALLISSCATRRVGLITKNNLICKSPDSRYDYGRKKSLQTKNSISRKNSQSVYQLAWNKTHKTYASKRITEKGKKAERNIYNELKAISYNILAEESAIEKNINQLAISSLTNDLFNFEWEKIQDQENKINEPENINYGVKKASGKLQINSTDPESVLPYFDSGQEVIKRNILIRPSDIGRTSPGITGNSGPTQKISLYKRESFILFIALLFGLIPLGLIKANPKLAANISFWAAMNPWKTRFMFAGIQAGLIATGLILGERLAYNGIHFSNVSKDLLIGAFLTSSLLYPVKHTSIKLLKHSYLRQKAFDLTLAVSGFMLMVAAGNDPVMRGSYTKMISFINPGYENRIENLRPEPKQLLYYQNDGQQIKEQAVPDKEDKTRRKKTLATIFASLGFLALGFLVAGAACSLSCNGMEGLAYLVGIGGGALIIGLWIYAIKSIWHPKPKTGKKPPVRNDATLSPGSIRI